MARYRNMHISNNVGLLAATGVDIETFGDPGAYKTHCYLNSVLPAIAGGAALGVGKKFLTFPAGEIQILGSSMSMAIKQTQGHINADTPTVGIGTVIASGAVSVLSGTATFQNVQAGIAAADANGTPTLQTLNTALAIALAGSHDLFFNAAATWAASGDAAALLSGEIIIDWRFGVRS